MKKQIDQPYEAKGTLQTSSNQPTDNSMNDDFAQEVDKLVDFCKAHADLLAGTISPAPWNRIFAIF